MTFTPKQTAVCTGTGGTFRLSYGSAATAPIAFDATAAQALAPTAAAAAAALQLRFAPRAASRVLPNIVVQLWASADCGQLYHDVDE